VRNNPLNYVDPSGHVICNDEGVCFTPPPNTGISGLVNNNSGSSSGESSGNNPQDIETSLEGEKFIKFWEKDPPPLYPYPDLGGNCTIGWGHLLPNDDNGCRGWPNKTYGNGITTQLAQKFFDADIKIFEKLIHDTITVDLSQTQFDALVSYTFNTGDQTNNPYFVKNIPELINTGYFEAAAGAIRRGPITSGDLESQTLVERRQREADLFLFGIYFP
jgi:lysozyme